MASKCSRIISRASLNSLKSAVKTQTALSPSTSPSLARPSTTSFSNSSLRRFALSRVPSELGAVQSMMPLHSAVATARMTSCLSSESRSCRALSQGT